MRFRNTGVLLWLAAVAAAPAVAQRSVTVQNLTPHQRSEWACLGVPFSPGEVPDTPNLHVKDHATVWQPFGARWPDGSLRQALCLFRPHLQAHSEVTLTLETGPGPELGPTTWPELPAEFGVAVWQGKRVQSARPQFVEMLEQNAARRVALFRCRIGDTGLVFEMIIERYADQEHAWVDVALFFSDPTTKAMQCAFDKVVIGCAKMAMVLRHAGLFGITTEITDAGSQTVLLGKTSLGDGQGVRRSGVLVPALHWDDSLRDETAFAAVILPLLAATDWRGSGAWGPFGYVPEPPPWLRGSALRRALNRRHATFFRRSRGEGGDPFRVMPFGLQKSAGQTGDQEDFGVAKLEAVAGTGVPSFLLEVEASVQQEACRPVHYYEADGSRVIPKEHPEWVVWSGRTHWHCGVSKDRLGKDCPEPRHDTHDWTGKDRQHWSSLYLCGYYLLTGKHWARREIENEIVLYLAGQTLDPELTTSTTGAPRGAGRVLLTASWSYLCTGDAELLERMHQRLAKIYAHQWPGRNLSAGQVRTFQVAIPDNRILDGKHSYWTPWQDSLAAIGLAAFHRISGDEIAGGISDALALNTLRNGWKTHGRGSPIIATAVRWRDDGSPFPEAELERAGPATVQWSTGTAFSVWSIGAVELARQAAARAQDTAMVARAEDILRRLRAQRRRPNDGWFDRFGEWDAVR